MDHVALLTTSLAALSYTLGVATRSEESLAPLRYIVDGLRDTFLGHYTTPTILIAFIVAITLTWGTHVFRRETA